jgi:hypothetical protein
MDFEELILKALQTKFPGVDAKILGRIAKKRAKTANTADQTEDGAKRGCVINRKDTASLI